MNIGLPQAIFLILVFIGMGSSIAKYGQQKKDHYDLFDVLASPVIVIGLTWWGGFYG